MRLTNDGRRRWAVRSGAGAEEIRAAYIVKANRLHPDVGGDQEAMRRLNAAREKGLGAK